MFYELMRRCGPFSFYVFDLLWLDGTDLRSLALSGRKALLRKLLPRKAHAVRYVEHVANGTDLFQSAEIKAFMMLFPLNEAVRKCLGCGAQFSTLAKPA
jgi:hypothetical protein